MASAYEVLWHLRIFKKYLQVHLKLTCDCQFGFRDKRSTIHKHLIGDNKNRQEETNRTRAASLFTNNSMSPIIRVSRDAAVKNTESRPTVAAMHAPCAFRNLSDDDNSSNNSSSSLAQTRSEATEEQQPTRDPLREGASKKIHDWPLLPSVLVWGLSGAGLLRAPPCPPTSAPSGRWPADAVCSEERPRGR